MCWTWLPALLSRRWVYCGTRLEFAPDTGLTPKKLASATGLLVAYPSLVVTWSEVEGLPPAVPADRPLCSVNCALHIAVVLGVPVW